MGEILIRPGDEAECCLCSAGDPGGTATPRYAVVYEFDRVVFTCEGHRDRYTRRHLREHRGRVRALQRAAPVAEPAHATEPQLGIEPLTSS